MYQMIIKNFLKIRVLESNLGVGSENRKEKGGKMSVYSTKKSQGRMLQGNHPKASCVKQMMSLRGNTLLWVWALGALLFVYGLRRKVIGQLIHI